MRNVIGFSLWGEQEHYYFGALENIELAKIYYPDYECLFYISNAEYKNELIKSYIRDIEAKAKVIYFDSKDDYEGMFVRFLPALENDVNVFLSRDCDSRLNIREQYAVNDWLKNTNYPFHIMRDHRDHLTEILGGMWGCRGDILKDLQKYLNEWTDYSKKGKDQEFLTAHIWPLIQNNHVAHDDAYDYTKLPAKQYPWAGYGDVRRFPQHPPMTHGTFVGEQFR